MKNSAPFLLTALFVLCILQSNGQTIVTSITGSGQIDLNGTGNGGVSFTPASQTGKVFLWWPEQSAFRVGEFTTTLNSSSIGQGSVALGKDTIASGVDSLALGRWAHASNSNSVAIGASSTTGSYAISLGGSASGSSSLALGFGSNAKGDYSTAIGNSYAFGYESVAIMNGVAMGVCSFAGGRTNVTSQNGTAFGIYNADLRRDGTFPDPLVASQLDPIFEIGNGFDDINGDGGTSYRNALTVFRDGTVKIGQLILDQPTSTFQIGETVSITGTAAGNVGIGTTTPFSALSFGATMGKSIALFEHADGSNMYGLSQGGNSAIGSNPYRLKLVANSLEAMSITLTGKVGIGTMNPDEKLHVAGGALQIGDSNGTGGGNRLTIDSAGSLTHTFHVNDGTSTEGQHGRYVISNYVYPNFDSGTDSGGAVFRENSGKWVAVTGGSSLRFLTGGTSPANSQIYNQYSASLRMLIDKDGNVGVGTAAPRANLDVAGTAIFESSSGRPITLGGNSGSIMLQGNAGGWAFGLHAKGSAGTDRGGFGFLGGADTLSCYYIGDSFENPTMIVQPGAGNVAIGTTNPGSYKLAVNGAIHAKEIVVDNNGWPDYVFDEGYRLAPLTEVELHLKKEKHLSGIPSAIEVAEHGAHLGVMQAKLLEKVEELTLYMIELKKENAALRQEMTELKAASVAR